MLHNYRFESGITLKSSNVISRTDSGPRQVCKLEMIHLDQSDNFEVFLDGLSVTKTEFEFGYNTVELQLPLHTTREKHELKAVSDKGLTYNRNIMLEPARPLEIHLLHHTHLDIGYTHQQDDVMKLQIDHIKTAIELGQRSKDHPPEAQFKWLPESLWAIEWLLETADESEVKMFLDAVQSGTIGLDGLYCNTLSGLNSSSELLELTALARKLQQSYDLPVSSAMITDIPGQTWGLVTAMAQSGLKYLSLGPNSGHRVGHVYDWADQPFFWVSPSGKEEVLTWVHGKGYSWFHTSIEAASDKSIIKNKLTDERITFFMEELRDAQYPYEMIVLRYNIGSDNGPPDPNLSNIVNNWNQRYESPKLVISTTGAAFAEFERLYGSRLPRIQGDFTPYWEDGAASTARETALSRNLKERIAQLSTVSAALNPDQFPHELSKQVWKNILLFDEHTWGAWDSISDPENESVAHQWDWKKNLLIQAQRDIEIIDQKIWSTKQSDKGSSKITQVFNSHSWPVSQIIEIQNIAGDLSVTNSEGLELPAQKIGADKWIFLAEDVPELGFRNFYMNPVNPGSSNLAGLQVSENHIENQFMLVSIDSDSGNISSIFDKINETEMVDTTSDFKINEYCYVSGRNPKDIQISQGQVEINIIESGPLRGAVEITTNPEGCEKLIRVIRMDAASPGFEIENKLIRKSVRTPEGIHFAFPFSADYDDVTFDLPLANAKPGSDQIQGACHNWYTVQNWVRLRSSRNDLVLMTPDTPLVELGGIQADATIHGWLREAPCNLPVFSYVMNNYWETNYKADQPGETILKYRIELTPKDQPERIRQQAKQFAQPLLSRQTDKPEQESNPFFMISGNQFVTAISIKPIENSKNILVQLWNQSSESAVISIVSEKYPDIIHSNLYGEYLDEITEPCILKGYELISVILCPGRVGE